MKRLTIVLLLAALVMPSMLYAQFKVNMQTQMQAAMQEQQSDEEVIKNLSAESQAFLNAINKFREEAANMLEHHAWDKLSKDPQEIIETKTNFLLQSFLINVVDGHQDYQKAVSTKVHSALVEKSDYRAIHRRAYQERDVLFRYLNQPIGAEKLEIATFIRLHISDCTHTDSVKKAIWNFYQIMEEAVK